jgi:hypothetical protein
MKSLSKIFWGIMLASYAAQLFAMMLTGYMPSLRVTAFHTFLAMYFVASEKLFGTAS